MSILITGGAGYIGSHTAKFFLKKNEDIIICDNLQSGHEKSVEGIPLYKVDLRNEAELNRLFEENNIDTVVHFAANSLVGESMENPYKYYHNNVYGMLCLLNTMKKHDVRRIVFSSSAATYGEPTNIPIKETDLTNPTNTYGETKLTMEKMMKWFEKAYGIQYVSLRYFNAAGAHESGSIGEDHSPETHLIPIVLQVALGKREKISIYGDDYPTRDGTCIRDYVHVMDLAKAHYLAVHHLINGGHSDIFNLGSGKGFSVKEIIDSARQITGQEIASVIGERRKGDPAILIASSDKAKEILNWEPDFDSIDRIIEDAWRWHRNNPNGYQN